MFKRLVSLLSLGICISCNIASPTNTTTINQEKERIQIKNPEGEILKTRFSPPTGFKRISVQKNSYGDFLQNLPLKPDGALVKYYDGGIKYNSSIYDAVIDLKIGKKNLHQCADAIMRLRAEYLWKEKKHDSIHFNFTNGFRVDYSKWKSGNRISIKGNKTWWKKTKEASNTYANFWNYMEIIFAYAGTASLSKELKNVPLKELKIGDIFIQGGFPGHAIIVVDVATHSETKEKLFILAQSYMPAQETQILKNLGNTEMSPWYSENIFEKLETPEWTFEKSDLKRFE